MAELVERLRQWIYEIPVNLRARLGRSPRARALVYRLRNAYVFSDLAQHDRMLHDSLRVDAYHRAIERHVAPGDVVVDVGTGTGGLAAFAARRGARVRRNPTRHYLGRLFATTASMVLEMNIYDTQCGAKLFRDTPALRAAMSQPFRSRWVFDVELLGRLTTGTEGAPGLAETDFLEIPAEVWEDVRGSKLGVSGALRGGMDLLRLGARVKTGGRGEFFPRKRGS